MGGMSKRIKILRSSVKFPQNFKSKRKIGADNRVITTRFNNYKFIKISVKNTYKSSLLEGVQEKD
jgi:hypothetical protein